MESSSGSQALNHVQPNLRLPRCQLLRANPVGGPVFVNGVQPGDTLVVDIERIAVRDWGWTGTIKGFGQLTGLSELGEIDEDFSTVVRHIPGRSGTLDDGQAVMNVGREVRWPLAPFCGVIVTAPERGVENTVTSQGAWGGDIDVRDICAGHKIYLNASHSGGLLFLGNATPHRATRNSPASPTRPLRTSPSLATSSEGSRPPACAALKSPSRLSRSTARVTRAVWIEP